MKIEIGSIFSEQLPELDSQNRVQSYQYVVIAVTKKMVTLQETINGKKINEPFKKKIMTDSDIPYIVTPCANAYLQN